MTKDIKKVSNLKIIVSFNGDRKLIYIDPFITFAGLKSKINEIISNHDVSASKLAFLYMNQFSDGGKKDMGTVRSDDDVRRMISGFELVEGVGRILVFACNNCCDVENSVFEEEGKLCEDYNVLRENLMNQLSKCEKDWNFSGLEEEILENGLDGIDGLDLMSGNECFNGRVVGFDGSDGDCDFSLEENNSGYGSHMKNYVKGDEEFGEGLLVPLLHSGKWNRKIGSSCVDEIDGLEGTSVDLMSGNECFDGRVIDFAGSNDDGNLSFEERNSRCGSQLKDGVEGDVDFGEGFLVPLLDSGKWNRKIGKSCVDENSNNENGKFGGLSVSTWGQGSLILDSEDGIYEENSSSGKTCLAASDSSLVLNTNEKEIKSREGSHCSCQYNLIMNRKDKDKNVSASSKAYDRMSSEVVACYNHLESIKLQSINYSDLEFVKQLGEGAYGIVHYGKWKGSDVAIKRLKLNCSTEGTSEEDRLVKDFWKEAQMLGKLHHPNIVALYGVVTDGPPKYLAAVTEYMVNGSLKQVLRRRDRTVDRRKRVIIARDAASGMEYLHENNIVHFDLKSHNLLVNMRDPQRPVCKIGDLGLSKIKQRSMVSGGFRGTLPWMAPELFDAKSMVTEKVDVYSFGIVMWELLTGETPYADMRSKEIIAGMIKGSLRPEIPSWCDPVWKSLMKRCWSSDPVSRPCFIEIGNELRAMAASMNIK